MVLRYISTVSLLFDLPLSGWSKIYKVESDVKETNVSEIKIDIHDDQGLLQVVPHPEQLNMSTPGDDAKYKSWEYCAEWAEETCKNTIYYVPKSFFDCTLCKSVEVCDTKRVKNEDSSCTTCCAYCKKSELIPIRITLTGRNFNIPDKKGRFTPRFNSEFQRFVFCIDFDYNFPKAIRQSSDMIPDTVNYMIAFYRLDLNKLNQINLVCVGQVTDKLLTKLKIKKDCDDIRKYNPFGVLFTPLCCLQCGKKEETCGTRGIKVSFIRPCSHCNLIQYCSVTCQLKHFKIHEPECKSIFSGQKTPEIDVLHLKTILDALSFQKTKEEIQKKKLVKEKTVIIKRHRSPNSEENKNNEENEAKIKQAEEEERKKRQEENELRITKLQQLDAIRLEEEKKQSLKSGKKIKTRRAVPTPLDAPPPPLQATKDIVDIPQEEKMKLSQVAAVVKTIPPTLKEFSELVPLHPVVEAKPVIRQLHKKSQHVKPKLSLDQFNASIPEKNIPRLSAFAPSFVSILDVAG